MCKLEKGEENLKPNLDADVMLKTRKKRDQNMFNKGLTLEQPINLDNLYTFSPLLAEVLKTEQQIDKLFTNPDEYKRGSSDE